MIVPESRAKLVRYSNHKNPKKYIVVHQTGNKKKGANAYMHARLQYNGNSRQASWHIQVDDKEAYQSFSYDDGLWHAGNRPINRESIGVEICVNEDGDYGKAVRNGISVVKYLMKRFGIKDVYVINHNDASGKWCPTEILNGKDGMSWTWFKKQLSGNTKPAVAGGTVKPSTTTPKFTGSIVDYLNQQGIASNINNRKNLAVEHGIVSRESDYTGTAKQNTDLLNAMMKGTPKQEGTRKEPISSGYTGNSIVDYLVSIKHPANFSDRKKLADANGVSNYTGTASQNNQLLDKLRAGEAKAPQSAVAKPKSNNVSNYKGDSIVDYLNLSGNKHLGGSSFNNRKKLAEANGIKGYSGTASQNKELLRKLQGGGNPAPAPTPATKKSINVNSIAEQIKKGIDNKGKKIPTGHEPRRKHFGLTKDEYSKVRARVNQIM